MPLFVRAGASWRKMLVQRPPMFDIGTLHIHRGFGDDRVKSSSIPVRFQSTPQSVIQVSDC
ncbi:hypothetical protein N7455_008729 [Penicillium solitum]|uniref:uncharacterized protein n=1 Tax=Penicillium solitum TaxID=60172 RepID=UPI0032C4B07F|nr:hypothetical protein N7455_008729 [Penicillium solitum]